MWLLSAMSTPISAFLPMISRPSILFRQSMGVGQDGFLSIIDPAGSVAVFDLSWRRRI
jgi:hypothetical protein